MMKKGFHMNTKKSINNWVEYYKNAARVRLDIELIKSDIEFEKNGGHIFYAVDSNILNFFTSPLGQTNKFILFKDEDKELLEGSAISIANLFLTDGLITQKSDCFLLPPEMIGEFISFRAWLSDQLDKDEEQTSTNEKKIEQITNLIDQVNKKPDDKKIQLELINYLVKKCKNLVRYLSGNDYNSHLSAMKRLAKIGKNKSLQGIHTNKKLHLENENEVINLADSWIEKFENLIAEQNRVLGCFRKIDSTLIRNDTRALARASLTNNQLTDGKIKLHYLTLDDVVSKLAKEEELNFIRNPRQYIYCIEFSKKHSFQEKLDILNKYQIPLDEFLKPFRTYDNDDYNLYLRNLKLLSEGKHDENKNIQVAIDAINGIDLEETKYTELKNNRMELLALSTMTNLHDKATELAKKLCQKDIHSLLTDRIKDKTEAIEKASLTLGVIGFTATYLNIIDKYYRAQKINDYPRGPVSLRRHDDYENGKDAFFERVHDLAYKKNWLELYQIIEGRTSYIKHLIYALVVADAGEWHRAKVFCEEALIHAKENEENEVLYFQAVILRHDCSNYNDYKNAKEKLIKAEEIWNLRYKNKYDPRFESERLALSTAYFNYDEFMPDESKWHLKNEDKEVPNFDKTWEGLCKLALEIENKEKQEKENTPSIISHRIKRQVYTNKCCLFVFNEYVEKKSSSLSLDNEGKEAYNKLKALTEEPNFRKSYLISFLLAFMKWHFDKCNDEEMESRRDAKYETKKASEYHTLPYEIKKFKHFLSILEGNI